MGNETGCSGESEAGVGKALGLDIANIFGMLVFCILIPCFSLACVMQTSLMNGIAKSSVIFSGTVLSTECLPDVKLSPEEVALWQIQDSNETFDIYKTVFVVQKVFIGEKSKEITIKETGRPFKGQHCWVEKNNRFEVDKEYLVYAYGNQDQTLSIQSFNGGGCGITKYLKSVSPEELSILMTPGNIFQEIADKKNKYKR